MKSRRERFFFWWIGYKHRPLVVDGPTKKRSSSITSM